jgi:glycosyltransferase involved in cell wall biosynthesis
VDAIRAKSGVLYPGCSFPAEDVAPIENGKTQPPLIIWNHRWEFDKNPECFFDALEALIRQGVDFRLALLGENCQTVPKAFIRARKRYGPRILQYGYVANRSAYLEWLKRGAIVVSTAQQENFGIAVIEAARFGCFPLLPDRLVYPEVVPALYHPHVLYQDQEDLVARLHRLIVHHAEYENLRLDLAKAMCCYAWQNVIEDYDITLESLADRS